MSTVTVIAGTRLFLYSSHVIVYFHVTANGSLFCPSPIRTIPSQLNGIVLERDCFRQYCGPRLRQASYRAQNSTQGV